jgi:galactonate dehydratase
LHIVKVEPVTLKASRRSTWSFVEITDSDGRVGVGETTVHRDIDQMAACVKRLAEGLMQAADPMAYLDTIPNPDDFIDVTARSGFNQALVDLSAQRAGCPIWKLHTGVPQECLPVYANINRRTNDRSPEGFARSASEAAAQGMTAFKIAPFDDVKPGMSTAEARPLLDLAFARIFAVREKIGEGRLMIDCHWRLNPETFRQVLGTAEMAKLFWIECPYPEDAEWYDAIRNARRDANARGILLAGLELKLWEPGFKPFIDHECYDVLMPDMKHVGGYERFYGLARAAEKSGAKIAPHNPTGPICHAHSVMASSAIENFLILEMQFDETRAFVDIVDGSSPLPAAGMIARVDASGLGLRLDRARLRDFVADET